MFGRSFKKAALGSVAIFLSCGAAAAVVEVVKSRRKKRDEEAATLKAELEHLRQAHEAGKLQSEVEQLRKALADAKQQGEAASSAAQAESAALKAEVEKLKKATAEAAGTGDASAGASQAELAQCNAYQSDQFQLEKERIHRQEHETSYQMQQTQHVKPCVSAESIGSESIENESIEEEKSTAAKEEKKAREATKDMMKEMLKEMKETKTALGDLQKVVKSSVEDKDNDNGELGSYFRALSVQGMKDELLKDAENAGLGKDADINDLLKPVLLEKGKDQMCPRDDRLGTAYVDALLDDSHAGRATIMISYTWEYKLLLIVDTLTEWCDKMKLPHNVTFVWFCCVCINQHRVQEKKVHGEVVSFKKFEQDFGRRVRGIRHVISLMSPWKGPKYITRSWCIFELFTAKSTNAKFELLLPKSEEMSFRDALWDKTSGSNMQECWKLLEKVCLEDAEATSQADKKHIDSLVKKGSGFEHLNLTVRLLLKEWFVENAVKQLQVLQEVKTNVNYTHACTQVGFFLEQMGRTYFVRAIEYYRGGLGMLTETNQHKTLQAVRLLTSIGSIKRRRGEETGALESFKFAQNVIEGLEPGDDVSNAKALLCDEMGLVSQFGRDIRLQSFEEALKIRTESSTLNSMDGAVLLSHYGRFLAESDAANAIPRFEQGIQILKEIDGLQTPLGASIVSSLANAKRKLDRPSEAMKDLEQCFAFLEKTESWTTVGAGVWSIRAETEILLERWDDALASYKKAREIREVCRAIQSIDGAKMFIGTAKVLLRKGDKAYAHDNIKEARCILQEMPVCDRTAPLRDICDKFVIKLKQERSCSQIFDEVTQTCSQSSQSPSEAYQANMPRTCSNNLEMDPQMNLQPSLSQ